MKNKKNKSINNYEINKILILGHSGYIGMHLMESYRKNFPEINVFGRSFPELDLTKISSIKKINDLIGEKTVVIMCSGIKKQNGDTLDIYKQNMAMVTNLCSLLQERPLKRLVYISSAEVYGEAVENTNITENTPVQPSSYYGIAKYASEKLVTKAIENHEGCSLLIVRPVLVYGPDEQGSFYGPNGFIRTTLKKEPIVLWGGGEELRDFLFIDDLVEVIVRLTFADSSDILNIVNGQSNSFKDVVNIISKMLPSETQVETRLRSKPKVDQAYINDKLLSLLPNISLTSLEDGIKLVINAELKVV